MSEEMKIACIETGGTTCYLGLANFKEVEGRPTFHFIDKVRIRTVAPEETVQNMIEVLKRWDFKSIGIASFGPVDVVKRSPTYGCMLKTPKPNWSYASILPKISEAFRGIPISIESDVYAPAMYHSIIHNNSSMCYITIGTGIGAGVYMPNITMDNTNHDNNKSNHELASPSNSTTTTSSLSTSPCSEYKECRNWRHAFTPSNIYPHSECGHYMIKPHPSDVKNNFSGACVFHGGCVEGMASALAISKRKGITIDQVKDIPKDDEVWDIAAYYIAGMIYNITLTYAPMNIVIGGGVIQQEGMIEKVRVWYKKFMNDYICYDWVYKHDPSDEYDVSRNYIVKSECKEEAGLLGAATIGLRSLI